jgi:hypothetical protein
MYPSGNQTGTPLFGLFWYIRRRQTPIFKSG